MMKPKAMSAGIWALLALTAATGFGQTGTTAKVLVATGRTHALNYKYLGGATRIGFRGTVLAPQAEGEAKVRNQPGGSSITAAFQHLQPATRFGPEYMTYVLWAISPAGRATNLGELVPTVHGRARIQASTPLQTFGLIVTAEPHFAVTKVGDLVVLENQIIEASRGRVEAVEASYELLPKGSYLLTGNPGELTAPRLDRRISPYVYQARNAVRIARAEQADRFAPDAFLRAEAGLQQVDAAKRRWKRPVVIQARQVAQWAEDARLIAASEREVARRVEQERAAEQAQQAIASARAEAEAARAEALADRAAAAQEVQHAKRAAVQEGSTTAHREIRKKLLNQLGALLETQDEERGLIVRMSSMLFTSGGAQLHPQAREKLSKVAGILLAYPGLKLKVEGHADSTGRPAFNQRLSEQRAANVRAFLVRQGLSPQVISAEGLGDHKPLTGNDTPVGRQKNRRVELVVAGGAIGI